MPQFWPSQELFRRVAANRGRCLSQISCSTVDRLSDRLLTPSGLSSRVRPRSVGLYPVTVAYSWRGIGPIALRVVVRIIQLNKVVVMWRRPTLTLAWMYNRVLRRDLCGWYLDAGFVEVVVLRGLRRRAGPDVGNVNVGMAMVAGRPGKIRVSIDRWTLVDNAPHEQRSEAKELPRSTCPSKGRLNEIALRYC